MRFSIIATFSVVSSALNTDAFSIVSQSNARVRRHISSSTIGHDNAGLSMVKTPVFDEVCDTTGVTLKRFMAEVSMLNPELEEIQVLFGGIETACKAISNQVKRSQLPSSETLGYDSNSSANNNNDRKTLDVITNDLLKRALRFTGRLGVLASEEEETPVSLEDENEEDDNKDVLIDAGMKYCAVFDPLNGSSNVEAGIPTGTIIGIYEYDQTCEIDYDTIGDDSGEDEAICLANTLQAGKNLVAAAYCLYSSSTFLVLTLGAGTYGFTLDENLGEFILSHPKIRVPDSSAIYSFNEANFRMWDEPLKETVQKWKEGTGASGKQFSSRYIGSMVGDVHRTLLFGGVFGYPSDDRNPDGKLRLVYEAAPMSFIMEQAGGISTTGTERVMDLQPDYVHERIPIIMGSRNDVQEVMDAYSAASQ